MQSQPRHWQSWTQNYIGRASARTPTRTAFLQRLNENLAPGRNARRHGHEPLVHRRRRQYWDGATAFDLDRDGSTICRIASSIFSACCGAIFRRSIAVRKPAVKLRRFAISGRPCRAQLHRGPRALKSASPGAMITAQNLTKSFRKKRCCAASRSARGPARARCSSAQTARARAHVEDAHRPRPRRRRPRALADKDLGARRSRPAVALISAADAKFHPRFTCEQIVNFYARCAAWIARAAPGH